MIRGAASMGRFMVHPCNCVVGIRLTNFCVLRAGSFHYSPVEYISLSHQACPTALFNDISLHRAGLKPCSVQQHSHSMFKGCNAGMLHLEISKFVSRSAGYLCTLPVLERHTHLCSKSRGCFNSESLLTQQPLGTQGRLINAFRSLIGFIIRLNVLTWPPAVLSSNLSPHREQHLHAYRPSASSSP